MTIERMELNNPNFTADRLEALRKLIPEAFSEGRVDFERLRAALGDVVDERPERYSFTWAGKREAIRLLQTPSRATLAPAREESVDWETTRHLFIEGDNLEVLKLLYKAYFGKVKLIYIDPPYNTGNDFVYPDDFADPLGRYLEITGQKDAQGNWATSNPETGGRYHSAWLSMMYPRLTLARQLMHNDGILFMSINDSELHHAKMLLDEVFGDETFIGVFVWKSRHNVDSRNKTGMSVDHEYVLCYGRKIQGREIDPTKYANPDNDPRGAWMSDNMLGLASKDKRPNLHYDLIDPATGINYGCPESGWRYGRDTMSAKIAEGRVLWPSSPSGRPREKKFLAEVKSNFTGISSLLDVPTTSAGSHDLRSLFGAVVFDFPKPVGLVRKLIDQAGDEQAVILDFFAGSAPLAQAVLEANAANSSHLKFVLIQLPEPTGIGSPAYEAGFINIAEIGKERIRRVLTRIEKAEETGLQFAKKTNGIDLGFRVFKLAPSALRAWRGTTRPAPGEYVEQMALLSEPLHEGWRAEDVVWEVAIKEGYPLTSEVTTAAVAGQAVWRVADPESGRAFHVCLDDTVGAEVALALGLEREDLLVVRDAAVDDTVAANLALQCRLKTL